MENTPIKAVRITKEDFNKRISTAVDKYMEAFQKDINDVPDLKSYLIECQSKIERMPYGDDIDITDPLRLLLGSDPNSDDYDNIESAFSRKSVAQFNSFIESFIDDTVYQIVTDELYTIYWDKAHSIYLYTDRFAISTKNVFQSLEENWKVFDREFLVRDVHFALVKALADEIPMPIYDNKLGPNHQLISFSDDINTFPLPTVTIQRQSKSNREIFFVLSLRDMNAIVKKDDFNFDLLFAIQFRLTDIMETDQFLDYHWGENFEGDITTFKWFLERLLMKYDSFLFSEI